MERPAAITVFGIMNIVFGVLGVFGLIGSVFVVYGTDPSTNPVVKIIHDSPAYAAFMKLSIPLGFLSCVILLVGGLGLLRLKSWGRTLSIVYGIYAILFGILGLAMNFQFLVRPLLEQASHVEGPAAAGAIGGAIGGCIGGALGLVYPVALLFFMMRPKLAAAFRPPPPLPSA